MGLSDYMEQSESRWRYAEANVVMLRDALTELHRFIVEEGLDPDPAPIEHYLAWDEDRLAALREVLYARQP